MAVGCSLVEVPHDKLIAGQRFNDEMTICIDGVEVIRAYSSLILFEKSRKNRLVSESGEKELGNYKQRLSLLFEKAEREHIPEDVMWKIAETVPDIRSIEEWIFR